MMDADSGFADKAYVVTGGTQGIGKAVALAVALAVAEAGAEAAQPFGQLIKSSEVARMCVFLLGPDPGVMTGSLIDYDQNVIGAFGDG